MKHNLKSDPPLLDPRDLDFLLYEWLDVESLCTRERYREHSQETFDAVLDLTAELATKRFAPHNKLGDTQEPSIGPSGAVVTVPAIKEALTALRETGLLAGEFDARLDGMQLPYVVSKAAFAWLQAANISTSAYAALTIANAHLLEAYGTEEQIDRWVRPMLAGRFFGTMCLSEPGAGSSLADLTTRAIAQDDGTYRLTGSKMWITGGDHEISENIVHLVLARTPGGPAGVKGISLFIVPKYLVEGDGTIGERNDVALAGLNHKMGNRGTTNALLNLGDGTYRPAGRAGAVGYRVGQENQGLTQMFHMMNEARVGVGLAATALGYTAYLQSLDYARTRIQGHPLGRPHEGQVPIIAHPDVRRTLLAQKSYVEGALALGLYCAHLVDDVDTADDPAARKRAELLLELLTPIAKSWPSQWALEANFLAIQIHGGYGYTRDYHVEQLYRDNRLNAIHEGTHAIHGLDLLGRKVLMADGAALRVLLETFEATSKRATDASTPLREWGERLQEVGQRVANVTEHVWRTRDPELALANASTYLEAVGHCVIAWIWLEQALTAEGKTGDFYEGKRHAARYFFTYELPKTDHQFDLLMSLDRTTLDLSENWF
ncbi:acyl-CoA dehydrogenase [Rhodococcus sp. MSC1_016]|uniref:acyl-CoA dehydrogenase n=1 Tax=Rhodococcus sp. MSC1_016 TaxID=2909266 RepID=UPI00202ED59F|nr:acyl-CoA dehydrogenase [Rhodococcus sp. MSC1_016]